MSRTSQRALREASRRRRRRQAVALAVATVLVAAVVAAGTLFASGVWGLGGSPVAATGVSATAKPVPTPSPTASAALPAPTFTEEPAVTDTPAPPAPSAPPAFDKAAYSIDDPLSPWVVVDKLRPLADGANYVPPDLVDVPADIPNPNGHQLRADAANALEEMAHAALNEIGVQLIAQSGYRSYASQVNAYGYYVNSLGVAGADLTSARPGYSEHQTGMALDILSVGDGCDLDSRCFADTAAGQWLAANAYRFGWILRYPDGGTPVTGYEFEPWHYRWVGVPLATEMHDTGVSTLEEFFGLPAAPGYAG